MNPRLLYWAAVFPMALSGCGETASRASLVAQAELGVYYGGQIQERDEIAFEVDPTKPSHGFRLTFAGPVSREVPVQWEIDVPAKSERRRALPAARAGARVARIGQHHLAVGQTRLEQAFVFEPGDPLGIWNFRVVVADELVIDRSVLVFDAAARARSQDDSGG